jgi:excinuclease ABC subunit B
LPEVSLVAIIDADKEGFLRSDVTLVQTMGRAARHIEGHVVLYADRITDSMARALSEVKRRREYQVAYNKKHNITPTSVQKAIREKLVDRSEREITSWAFGSKEAVFDSLPHMDLSAMTPMEKKKLIKNLQTEMRLAAQDLNFELAASIRDKIHEIN